jgi:NitT/TauT family transport system substrate-binding protein
VTLLADVARITFTATSIEAPNRYRQEFSMKRQLVTVIAVAAALVLAGCSSEEASGSDGSAPDRGKLVVGVVPSSNVAPLYLGVSKGIFEKHGLELDLRPAAGFAANVASVSNGETHIGFGTTVPIVGAIANGVPIKLIAHSDVLGAGEGEDNSGLFVPPGSDIKDIGDLEGKTVAVNALSNVFDVSIKAAMIQAGADPSKVKFLEVALPDMVAALDTGRVDAAAMGEPFVTLSRTAGNKEILKPYTTGFEVGSPIASYFVSTQWAEKNKDLIADFVAALEESSVYAAGHLEEARKMMETYTQIPPKVLSEVLLGKYQSTVDDKSLQSLVDVIVSTGTILKAPKVDALVAR